MNGGEMTAVERRLAWWDNDARYKAPEQVTGDYFRRFFVDVMRTAGRRDVARAFEEPLPARGAER